MIAATWPRGSNEAERLLRIDPARGAMRDHLVADLPSLLDPGDLLVVNDAATLPASLRGETNRGEPIEVRLLAELDASTWSAVLFGRGDWRTDTDLRPAPPEVRRAVLATLAVAIEPICGRIVRLRFDAPRSRILDAIYAHGRPVQYAYTADELPLEAVQTGYASRPWAAEMPSAGRALRFGVLLEVLRRGVELAALTHAAGLSACGAVALDRALPLPERFEIPPRTADAIAAARQRGGRVVAVGTSTVRALEASVREHGGQVRAGHGVTDLRIDGDFLPRVVSGLITNMHERGESHFELLSAFAPASLLERATAHANAAGYLAHEFGDSALILAARV